MKKFPSRWTVVPASLLFSLLGAVLPVSTHAQQPAQVAPLEFHATDVAVVRPGYVRQTMSLTGPVRPIDQAQVKTPMEGIVRQVLVREGSSVKAGDVVVRMDDTEYQAQVTAARGALAIAQAQKEVARKARVNSRSLAAQGYISEGAADTTLTQLSVAQANVDSAQAALDLALKALGNTIIRAPIAGLVNGRAVRPGDRIAIDSRLLDIIDLSRVELETAVSSTQIQRVTVGQEATVALQGVAARLRGRVARINPATQSGTPNVMAYIEIDNPRNLLRAGMFAQAELTLLSLSNVLTVPQTSIQLDGDVASVYTVERGVLARRPVVLGARGQDGSNDVVEVRSGLSQGAMVVRNNMGGMAAGVRVKFAPGQTPVRTPAATMTSAPANVSPVTSTPAATVNTPPTLTSGITAAPPAATAPAAVATGPTLTSGITASAPGAGAASPAPATPGNGTAAQPSASTAPAAQPTPLSSPALPQAATARTTPASQLGGQTAPAAAAP